MTFVSRRRAWTALGCAIVGLALRAEPASADWQYTQWGMSPDEVKTASGGVAVENRDRSLDADGLTARLVAPFQGVTLPFSAVFLFGIKDRLAVVTLIPRDAATCAGLPGALQANYGPPLSSEDVGKGRTARWNDLGNDNLINFLDLGEGGCSIEYSKLPDTHNDGSP